MTGRVPHRRTRYMRRNSRDPVRTARRNRTDEMPPSYFALFDLEARFALPADQLDRAYRAIAARVHPDRHPHAGAAGLREAHVMAALANEAYRTLRKPVPRAQHLLQQRGVSPHARDTAVSQDFLLEQMEWREALADARNAHDVEALKRLGATIRVRAAALQVRLEIELDAERNDSAAAETLRQLMFVEKLLADLGEACASLED